MQSGRRPIALRGSPSAKEQNLTGIPLPTGDRVFPAYVELKNTKTGEIGLSYGCTIEGDTVQVQLPDGSLDSWPEDDCEMIS